VLVDQEGRRLSEDSGIKFYIVQIKSLNNLLAFC
jgi:hypothetical protein